MDLGDVAQQTETPKARVDRRVPRVLFYDMWLKGLEKFSRLVVPGEADYRLLHFGSYRGEVPALSQTHGAILCTEFTAFHGASLQEIVRILAPDVVVGLNLTAVVDRAMILACRNLGIPTVFLQHGAWLDADQLNDGARELERHLGWRDYVARVGKYARYASWYVDARDHGLRETTPWQVVWRHMKAPARAHEFPFAARELWPTRALMFSKKDADILQRSHEIPTDRVRVIGNPETDAPVRRRAHPSTDVARKRMLTSVGLRPDRPVVTYLEEGWVEALNYQDWTDAIRVERVREVARACTRAGAQLLIRPHPVTNVASLAQAFAGDRDVRISRELSLIDSVDVSVAVVGVLTTAIETAVILGKPVLVPAWHLARAGTVVPYLRHGVATAAGSEAELEQIVKAVLAGNPPVTDGRQFVDYRLNPLDGRATERARTEVLSFARAHAGDASAAEVRSPPVP